MRALVIRAPDAGLDPDFLESMTNLEVKQNSYPDDGLAIIDCGKDVDWAWPDFTIVVGPCIIGRHHADMTIDLADDVNSQVADTLLSMADAADDTTTELMED